MKGMKNMKVKTYRATDEREFKDDGICRNAAKLDHQSKDSLERVGACLHANDRGNSSASAAISLALIHACYRRLQTKTSSIFMLFMFFMVKRK